MKILRLLTVLVIAALTFAACDDTTEGIGGSITNKIDNINISDSAFNVTTKSIVAGAVLSRNNTGLIGKMKDPETGNYVKGDYMTQLSVLPTFSVDTLDYIKQANKGSIEADSCYLLVSYNASYGDTIAPMKVTAYEMTKPMSEDQEYYSNYDAFKEGWVSETNQHWSSNYNLSNTSDVKNFKIYLNKEYKKDGKTYKNYGSYIMQTYAEHPEYFKTNYKFLHNVCPGFYIKNVGGTGNMAKIWNTELIFYWTRHKTIKAKDGVTDSTAVSIGYNRFDGTEEVLQLNKIENDTKNLEQLASQQNCTYLKSPAGIFTEVTLPIEDIMRGHEKDTLNTASISFPRLNNADEDNAYNFATPSTILMVQKDSLQSFFEKSKLADNRTSYTASYSSTGSYKNAYTFQNIANLVSAMYKNKGKGENWNKVVLVPVNVITTTQGYTTVISKINHDMSLASTRLIVGTDDPDKDYTTDKKTGKKVASGPIRIKVIYSKFKEE
jgi:predicted small secreted protein